MRQINCGVFGHISSHVLFTLTNRDRLYHRLTGSAYSAFHLASAKARAGAGGTGPNVFLFLYENPRRVSGSPRGGQAWASRARTLVVVDSSNASPPRNRGWPPKSPMAPAPLVGRWSLFAAREDEVQSPASAARPRPPARADGTRECGTLAAVTHALAGRVGSAASERDFRVKATPREWTPDRRATPCRGLLVRTADGAKAT